MKVFDLKDMTGGWFVGNFQPTASRQSDFEAAVKFYRAGETEALHVHRKATEITVVVSGRVRMAGQELASGKLIVLFPGEASDFFAIEDSALTVLKFPSAPDDKEFL